MTARHDWRLLAASIGVMSSLAFGACSEKPAQPPPQGTSAYRQQVLADKPAGYWRLDEASGTVAFDQTANANHGTIVQSGVTVKYAGATTGDGDTGMFFDGLSGQIAVRNSPSLQMRIGAATLEAWVKPVGIQPGTIFIIGKGTAGVHTEYGLVLANGIPGYQSVVELYLSTAPPIATGVWTHLAVTIALNYVGRFYINGKEGGTFPATSGHAITSSTQPVMIANEAGAATRFLGAIDEPAIYSHALTAEELARHATLGLQGND